VTEAVNSRIQSTTPSSEEALQVCNFRRDVQEIILQEQTDDLIQWNRHSQCFSVKSVYTFLKSAPFIKTQIANIWKLPVAPRIIVFMWLVLRNSILTLDNLKKKKKKEDGKCQIGVVCAFKRRRVLITFSRAAN
jgi:zinc-binding in reverse transcriptase